MSLILDDKEIGSSHADEDYEISYDDLSRRDVRSLIFHVLYAMEGFDYQITFEALIDDYNRGFNLAIGAESEVYTVSKAVTDQRDYLDEIIKPLLANWRFERIGVCTKLILRFAIWELENTDTPSIVIINEAIELAKCFAEKDAHKFINGILDKLVKSKEAKKDL